MALRTQKTGKQKPWTIDELTSGLEHFYNEKGRYPTGPEVDSYPYLPSARCVERSFGGLVALRSQLKLKSQNDFRTGDHSAKRALTINKRAHTLEQEVYDYLKKRFGTQFVHREYFFSDDRRTRADFFIFDDSKGFCVDVFYPSDRRNLVGCLNSKLNKYHTECMRQYPVIFLQMNKEIDQGILDDVVLRKDKKLDKDQYLMTWDTFTTFCSKRNPLTIGQRL